MAQDSQNILPVFFNSDVAFEKCLPNESPFIKGCEASGLNANPPDLGIGTNNPTGEGSNNLVLTPHRSNIAIPNTLLPEGYNKNVMAAESITTQELYCGNYNSNGNHGVYVYSGNTGIWQQVIVDRELLFSDAPESYISEHRVLLRVRRNELNEIVEKYLEFTDGTTYHKWIDVIASIKTNGFNANQFSYFTLQPPHFDRQELLAWAVRSPMAVPVCSLLPNTSSETGKPNKILGAAFQICYQAVFTDGRETLVSPFSLPVIIKKTDFLSNPDLIPKRFQIEMDAGSSKWEKINIFVRTTAKKSDSTLQRAFGDWYLYDTIYKFSDSGANSPTVIGNDYWLRTGGWSAYSYNAVRNTIKYIFDNTKLGLIKDQDLFSRLNNEMPQLSVAASDLGDAALLANNRYGFDNFGNDITDKLSTNVIENTQNNCPLPTREIKLYVYAARERGNGSGADSQRIRNIWLSQVGFVNGADTQVRWGGLYPDHATIKFDLEETNAFDLNFADKQGFRCYLKGTQYYADCEWHICTPNFELQKIPGNVDIQNAHYLSYVENAMKALSFFVGVFTFKVPAGRYTATLGRHNIPSEDNYRDKSTYIMGIANSRLATVTTYLEFYGALEFFEHKVNTVKSSAIIDYSKEMEIDCTAGDVDVWKMDLGNPLRKDLFYVLTPFIGTGNTADISPVPLLDGWQFVEGNLLENNNDQLPVEKFPYYLQNQLGGFGLYTDKNGFFFSYNWGGDFIDRDGDLVFNIKKDCVYPSPFTVLLANGAAWKRDIIVFFSTYNGGTVGTANRVILEGYVRDITNTIPYSNIAVSLVDTETAYTDGNGKFTIIVHNGFNFQRINNIYVNAAGNFNITLSNCGQIPLFNYTEPVCQTTQERRTPLLIVNVNVQSDETTSLKSGASYLVGVVGADIACRVTYVNKFSLKDIPLFPQRNNVNATQLQWLLSGNLQLQTDIRTKDLKWLSFFIINATNYRQYIQWVGNKIEFIDANGNVTTNTSSASLVRINISSLLETNIKNNFTLIANYQFKQADRLRVYDNGAGILLNTSTYGDVIDLEIQGTNYNQAAINANLIPPSENVVLNAAATAGIDPTTIYIKYDNRFNALKDKTGFWIEIYTPSQTTELLPLYQGEGWYPVINGEIARYVSGGEAAPVYTFPTSGIINYWDTYFIRRSIIGLGQFISHPFESPNITDVWGANVVSGGKTNTINANAQQLWYNDDTIKSDDFLSEGIVNGLSFFRSKNRKNFKGYRRGGIVAISCQFSIILFICENDWFVTDYNFNYIYANAQGIQVANLDNNLSVPHQKIGQNFGCRLQDTQGIILFDEYVWWIDNKNQSAILCNYKEAVDVSDITDQKGEKKYGIKSYLYSKLRAIENWNNNHSVSNRFDILCGIDIIRKNIHVTFRPRRNNSNTALSYVNRRRDIDPLYQETIVYNLDSKRWLPLRNFTPEAYGKVRGNQTGVEFLSFAAGKPYLHNQAPNSFLNYYGIQTEPVITAVVNRNEDMVKILQAMSIDINNSGLFADLVYSTQAYGYSYVPFSVFVEREKMFYAAFLRDMVTYLQDPVKGDYRSTLQDGKRLFGEYFVIRFIQEFAKLGQYFELNSLSFLYTSSVPVKPPVVQEKATA